MDVKDSFPTFYPNYYTNRNGPLNSWTPNVEHKDTMMGPLSKNLDIDDEFDYNSLIELFKSKTGLDNPHFIRGETFQENLQGTPLRKLVGNLNWSDFDNHLSKPSTMGLSNAKLKSNRNEVYSQLKPEWETRTVLDNNPHNQNSGSRINSRPKSQSNINSILSKILDEGYETRLNSSRCSEKSTNRTSAPAHVANNLNGSLVGNVPYNINGNQLLRNNLLGTQFLNGYLNPVGDLNQNMASVSGLEANINPQLFTNQFINNQLIKTQLLNNQLLNSQMLATANILNANLAPVYRNNLKNEFAQGQFINPAELISSNFTIDPNVIPLSFYDYQFAYNKFNKQTKGQYNFKMSRNKSLRKKRGKNEMFPIPSLKDSEFDNAVEYLKQTLLSLYKDQIVPIYFNVRGRFIEFNSQDIAPEHIMDICKRKPDMFNVVSNGALNDTFIYLVEEPSWFTNWVDRNDLNDIYSIEMWEQFFNFMKNYRDSEGNNFFPGSIYGMSKLMQELKLPFLQGMSLGTICHIVQLAIRLKRYLVYDLKTLKPSEAVRNGRFLTNFENDSEVFDIEKNQCILEESTDFSDSQNSVFDKKSGVFDENSLDG